MINIQELNKNLPANMTKVLINFNEMIRLDGKIALTPIDFITRLYNIEIMINHHTKDGHYFLTLGKCRERYYMEDHEDFQHRPATFSTYEVSKEDYDQFVAFRKHPMMYLKRTEGFFYCSCNNDKFDYEYPNPNIMICKKCHKRYDSGNPFDPLKLIPYRTMINPIMELEV